MYLAGIYDPGYKITFVVYLKDFLDKIKWLFEKINKPNITSKAVWFMQTIVKKKVSLMSRKICVKN